MKLNELAKNDIRGNKRLGRGHGSGKGKTSGRGYKGQKAKETIKLGFEGGQLRLIKRLPFRRGVGNSGYLKKALNLNVSQLESLPAGAIVDFKLLVDNHVIAPKENTRIKILGGGELTKALTVKFPVSASAQQKIEKAGGSVVADSDSTVQSSEKSQPTNEELPATN